jgi:hypothetical protein
VLFQSGLGIESLVAFVALDSFRLVMVQIVVRVVEVERLKLRAILAELAEKRHMLLAAMFVKQFLAGKLLIWGADKASPNCRTFIVVVDLRREGLLL